jgi:hypothetical protein
MKKPLIVSIPHNLGREEARKRLQSGLERVRGQFGGQVAFQEETWSGDHLDFRVGAMGQSVTGRLDVEDQTVRLEVDLPWVLSIFAEKAKALIQRQGTLMLEKK